ncbi:unnamed protein product, partial [Polarella glacialis]
EMFQAMDTDNDDTVTREEAMKFFKSFAKVSAAAMFKEVDGDHKGGIELKDFMGFWDQVHGSGYTNEEIAEELEELNKGGTWVDWKDNRDVGNEGLKMSVKD